METYFNEYGYLLISFIYVVLNFLCVLFNFWTLREYTYSLYLFLSS